MHTATIVEVRLRSSAAHTLSHAAHTRTTEWLSQWTPRNNFKAVLTDSFEKALDELRSDIKAHLVPSWLTSLGVTPAMFEFRVADREILNNRFWPENLGPRGSWFNVE